MPNFLSVIKLDLGYWQLTFRMIALSRMLPVRARRSVNRVTVVEPLDFDAFERTAERELSVRLQLCSLAAKRSAKPRDLPKVV